AGRLHRPRRLSGSYPGAPHGAGRRALPAAAVARGAGRRRPPRPEEQPRVSHLPALSTRIVATLLEALGRRAAAPASQPCAWATEHRHDIARSLARLATGRLDGGPSI